MEIVNPEWPYPVYLNPTFDEILKLAKTNWDTIRICYEEKSKDLYIASGYGNTHTSVSRTAKQYKNNNRLYFYTYILYRYSGKAYMNLIDVGESDDACYDKWKHEFDSDALKILKDLVRESNLNL